MVRAANDMHVTTIEFAHLEQRLGLDGINVVGFTTNTHDKVRCLDRGDGGKEVGRGKE